MTSKRNLRKKSCTGKVRHLDERGARGAADLIDGLRQGLAPVAPYRSRYCGGYHTGRQPLRVRIAKEQIA